MDIPGNNGGRDMDGIGALILGLVKGVSAIKKNAWKEGKGQI